MFVNHLPESGINKGFERDSFRGLSFKTCSQCGDECDTHVEIGESVVGHICGRPRYEAWPCVVSDCCNALVRDENGNEVIYDG